MNSIFVIKPYKALGMWVFDDPARGLIQEPFVAGADTLIDLATIDIPDAETGFALVFSATEFPGYHLRLEWRREEMGGNTYHSSDFGVDGWLCPALFKYFEVAPKEIFVQLKSI